MANQDFEKKVKFSAPASRPKAQARDLTSKVNITNKSTVNITNQVDA